MGGRSSRTKGHAFERYVAQRLRPYDKACRRNVSESQVASIDIITKLPFGIQLKRMRAWPNPSNVYIQAVDGTKQDGVIPMGIVKVDFENRIVCFMAISHFRIFFDDMMKIKSFVYKRRQPTVKRKKIKDITKRFEARRNSYKKKVTPYTVLTECFNECLPGQHPIALWHMIYKKIEKRRMKKGTVLACFDFELFITQIEKVYGKEKDSSNLIQL